MTAGLVDDGEIWGILADWAMGATLFDRMQATIRQSDSHDDWFVYNKVAILAEERIAAGNATWMYWFTWASPAFHGRLGSCHAMDIPFGFHNLGRKGVAQFTGEGDDRVPVADAYSGSVLDLARTGAVAWPAYDTTTRATMVFDVVSHVVDDPESAIRELW